MLIKFSVSNFLSFDEKQTLSMTSGVTKLKSDHIIENEKIKLLKFSAIYGANSSGKTNFVKAVSFAKSVIIEGVNFDTSNLYCRINNENKFKESYFDFEIKIRDKIYRYGFSINLYSTSIKSEWLKEVTNKEKTIFYREHGNNIELLKNYFSGDMEKRLFFYSEDMKNQDLFLFLTVMNKDKSDLYNNNANENIIIFEEIYEWIKNSLIILSPTGIIDNAPYFNSEESLDMINVIMSKFGTGIVKCKNVAISEEELKLRLPINVLKNIQSELEKVYLKNNKKSNPFCSLNFNNEKYFVRKDSKEGFRYEKVILEHKNSDSEYTFSEESDGTKRIFDLLEILLPKKEEKIYFVDEFGRGLHPQLSYKFIETFLNDKRLNNSQLVVTSHESRLLDFDLVRRDEIWFVERKNYGSTKMYSLESFNERFDKKIDKAYFEGKYGAIPEIL